jgi:hypothetical protein
MDTKQLLPMLIPEKQQSFDLTQFALRRPSSKTKPVRMSIADEMHEEHRCRVLGE